MTNVHIHHTPMQELRRVPNGKTRWCFGCRKRESFDLVVLGTVEPSYYDPTPKIVCRSCGQVDGDLFPGLSREWE